MIKRIFFLSFAMILMCSNCSAAPLRLSDVTLNEFVSFYNQMAKEMHARAGDLNVSLNQKPWKNLAVTDSNYPNYTVYTSSVGKGEHHTTYIHFFVDKSGYIYRLLLSGNTKQAKQEKQLTGILVICMLAFGVNYDTLQEFADEQPAFLNYTNSFYFPNTQKGKKLHLDTHVIYNSPEYKYNPVSVDIYATSM